MKVLIFGGTTEGKRLADVLSTNNVDVTLCVATDYGKSVIKNVRGLKIAAKRLNQAEMALLLKKNTFDYVVDATHPYAQEVTQNIRVACFETNTDYLRLIRDTSDRQKSVIYVDSAVEAAEFIKDTTGNVLMAIGSKELEAFTAIESYEQRLYIRIIPMMDSLQKVIDLGFKNPNIICMQGPFSIDINATTLKMINAKYMVTKDSGEAGGFLQKLEAAEQVGCKVIVIARPVIEKGYRLDEILGFFHVIDIKPTERFTYFPLFINLMGKKIIVIGGGKIAERRIKTLLPYDPDITVVSPQITDAIQDMVQSGAVKFISRKYESVDCYGAFLVIAATNDREVNQMIMKDAKDSKCFVIVSDSRADCDCYFPAIAENDELVAGMVSKNGNHKGLKEKAQELRRFLNHE